MKGLNKLIQNILMVLIEDEELMKLIYYNNQNDFETLPSVDIGQVVNRNLFDYTFIPRTETEANTYLSVSLDNIEKANTQKYSKKSETLKQLDVVFTIFTHHSLIKYSDGNRLLAILDRLEDIFYEARMEDVIGKFDFSLTREILTIADYSGYNMVFRTTTIPETLKNK